MDETPGLATAMGHGPIGRAHLEGKDTESVKVLEMAGTVVMVQESGGLPVSLERLPDIVKKCAEIYRARHPPSMPVDKSTTSKSSGTSRAAQTPTATEKKIRNAPQAPSAGASEEPPVVAQLDTGNHGIVKDAVLYSGKHRGRTFGAVYDSYPDYCTWILSQGDQLSAKSLVDFGRYIRLRKNQEHDRRVQGYMAFEDNGSEDILLAVLDTGCNQTCHGALWMKRYMEHCGLEYQPLDQTTGRSLKGIGGPVRALGKRVLDISLQLADGTLAHGTVESTELADSEAPLMSCQAQKQLGIVLDMGEHKAYSKVFRQHLDLVDRDGLPALRLLPLAENETKTYAMTAVEENEVDEDEADFWEQHGEAWVRVHVAPRKELYNPRREPSQEVDIEEKIQDYLFRKTVAIAVASGERTEFRDTDWRITREEEDVAEEVGGIWKGYTYFYKDVQHYHAETDVRQADIPGPPEAIHSAYAKFDEEKPITMKPGQKKVLGECARAMERSDTVLWAELRDKKPYQKVKRLLPRGCRTFLLEIFAGAATLTSLALGYGLPAAQPVDLMLDGSNLLDPKVRQQIWEQVEFEDPFLTAIAPVCAPWSSWHSVNIDKIGAERIFAQRRLWYPALEWVAKLVRQRTERGREVVLENPWGSLLWHLRCIEKLYGISHPVTEELLEVVAFDQCEYGLCDVETGLPHRKATGMLTASRAIKQRLSQKCSGMHQHQPLEGGRRAKLAAQWPVELCDAILQGAMEELQAVNCSVVFAAENYTEEQEEFGMIDGVFGENDVGVGFPSPLNGQEMQREETLEESTEVQQPEFEKERRRKWLRIDRQKRLAIRRLHHMTGHASNEAMMRVLRSAGTAPEVVSACRSFRCQACLERKRPPPPSSVATAPPYKFNHQLSCDAFEIVDSAGAKHTVLSLVDLGTKFHVAGRVSDGGTPSSKVCADFINLSWFAWAGAPKYFVCDQGVHNRGKVASLMRSFGVEIRLAGRQAPWQIGRTERHGGILKSMLKRVMTAQQVSGESDVAAAISYCTQTKNNCYNHDGYVPAQWVLGKIPPDISSLTEDTETEALGVHQDIVEEDGEYGRRMLIRQWAKEAFMYVDSSQRLRRAMLRQSHPLRGPYHTGDLVSYHRRGRWFGPARVLSMEGKSIWLVHGGMTVLVPETACRPASVEEIRRRQALETRPAGARAKRKYEDLLEDEEEQLPFSEEAVPNTEVEQIPYFDFGRPSSTAASPLAEPNTDLEATESPRALEDLGEEAREPERQVTQPEQEPGENVAANPSTTPSTSTTENQNVNDASGVTEPENVATNPSTTSTSTTQNQDAIDTSGVSVSPLQSAMWRSVEGLDGHPRARTVSTKGSEEVQEEGG